MAVVQVGGPRPAEEDEEDEEDQEDEEAQEDDEEDQEDGEEPRLFTPQSKVRHDSGPQLPSFRVPACRPCVLCVAAAVQGRRPRLQRRGGTATGQYSQTRWLSGSEQQSQLTCL